MANLNEKATIKTTNREGHVAYSMADRELLVTQTLTSFFGEPKFYGDNSEDLVKTAERVVKSDPEFVAKLAAFARNEFNMRTVSHVLTIILAHAVEGKPYTRKAIPSIVVRADDMTAIMQGYKDMYGHPFPNSLKRGIGDAFGKFNEYALAKYKGSSDKFKMRDVLRACHPTPKNKEQSELWKRVIADELATPVTWETELSANGNNAATWEKLLNEDSVGYMAMLRNLRNIIKANPANIQKAYDIIGDKERVLKSRQLPFRFLSAHKELVGEPGATSKVFDALEKAMDYAADNLPKISGKTAIAVDVSGSMRLHTVSTKSKITCAEVGLMLGVMASKLCEDSLFVTFDKELYPQSTHSASGVLSQVSSIKVNGGGTNLELVFSHLIRNNISVDRVLMFSDNEINRDADSYWGPRRKPVQALADEYRNKVNPNCWVHAVDLQGYGTQQFTGARTNIITGWSDRLLEFITLAEAGMGTLTDRIANYQL
jgi:hypothetical protein